MSVRRSSACARRPRVANSAIHNAAEALRMAVWLDATCCMADVGAAIGDHHAADGDDEQVPPLGRVERRSSRPAPAPSGPSRMPRRSKRMPPNRIGGNACTPMLRDQVGGSPDEIDGGEADDELRPMRAIRGSHGAERRKRGDSRRLARELRMPIGRLLRNRTYPHFSPAPSMPGRACPAPIQPVAARHRRTTRARPIRRASRRAACPPAAQNTSALFVP